MIATTVTLAEYLSHTYEPDCDFVDGVLEERNVGQKEHSRIQGRLASWFIVREKELQMTAFVEMRVRVALSRFRIPDVVVVLLPEPEESVFTTPPYVCIEVLSPDDSFHQMQTRIQDYREMGVENIWVVDPGLKSAYRAKGKSLELIDGGMLETLDGLVAVPLKDIFG